MNDQNNLYIVKSKSFGSDDGSIQRAGTLAVNTPPSSDFILSDIENNAFEFHPSRTSLNARHVYVMI